MEGILSISSGEFFYSLAAFFSGSAYLMRNILWLRVLLVVAALVYIFSGISLGITSMVGWNTVYLLINCFHIVYLLLDKVTFTLPEETRAIYRRYFSTLSTREFRKLVMSNGFEIFQDEDIVREYDVPDRLYIILRGKVDIRKDGRSVAVLRAGGFIGEMSFLSKEPASANAFAVDTVQCAFWTHDDLEKLERRNIAAYNKFIAIIGCDLVRKLNDTTEYHLGQVKRIDSIV